ncbi:DUF1365 domain-containing protein [Marinobacterium nitratireducens]|uniref:DUF1365 domain-containing protein n=1 Tax=Marinobacterium nitratireducens TaxID=518897 RepID=A0A917ZD46_9GAMM|nr:DUF1365 domain-containing protein [Marinobacterium nitratireducens]GGO79744.1 DUF1365 domain-containing protein [Marinobacterium nitratireducens]
MSGSALYVGRVMHHRLKPRQHRFRYRVFSLLLDLDELDALHRRLRLFSHNRFNLFSFHDRDYGDGSGRLKTCIEARLTAAGVDLAGGRIRLLCYPRLLGYVFNPLSVYYCEDRTGALRAILCEVSNTFGQRHSYLLPVSSDPSAARPSVDKCFYVSPFMPMDCRYAFRMPVPGERIGVHIDQRQAGERLFVASFSGRRAALTDTGLLKTWLTHPLMTLKVIAGIHWEALRLWLKGLKLQPRPEPPARPLTFGVVATTPVLNPDRGDGIDENH